VRPGTRAASPVTGPYARAVTQAPSRPAPPSGRRLLNARAGGSTVLVSHDRRAARAAFGSRRPWVIALVLYSALVAVVVGWPTPVDAGVHEMLTGALDRLHAAGVPSWVDYDVVERAANVAMFVPLGLLVTRVSRRWWWGLLVPAALSGAAELTQDLVRPERFATWTDVATNTSGAALGVVVGVVLMRRRARARGHGRPGGA
jgi:VanZ family protein